MGKSEITKYLASIGARGGAKSRRKLTKADARAMAKARWAGKTQGETSRVRGDGRHASKPKEI